MYKSKSLPTHVTGIQASWVIYNEMPLIDDFLKGFSNMCFNFPREGETVDVFFGYSRATNVDYSINYG